MPPLCSTVAVVPHAVRSLVTGGSARRLARALAALAAVATFAAGCASSAPAPPASEPPAPAPAVGTASAASPSAVPPASGAPRTVTLLAINDVYRIEGVDEGARGGIARVRTLREELEVAAPELLVLHAGDFLFPSLVSSTYGGAQMVDVLNRLDGDPGAFDERMFVVLGNHEFDRAERTDACLLDTRIEESEFTWLGTNVEFGVGDTGLPLVDGENLVPTALVESNGVLVGIFGITTDIKHPEYVRSFGDPVEVARRSARQLRERGAEVVVALTHQLVDDDVAMVAALGEDRPDLVIGGHEHEKMAKPAGDVLVLKADAEARTATVVELTVPPAGGEPSVRHRWVDLDTGVPRDAAVAARVDEWLERHDCRYCAGIEMKAGCLADRLALAKNELVAEELEIRRFETNLGDWIADRALAAYRPLDADLAFLNAGSMRLNQDIPAGTWITRRYFEELFPYPGGLELLQIDGATLQAVLDHAVSSWTGSGHWLQVAGLAFRHDPAQGTAEDLTLLLPDGGRRPIRRDDTLRVVTGSYLVDTKDDQDGYTMLKPTQRVDTPSLDLKELVLAALVAAGEEGIAPEVEGRICNPERPGKCLAGGGM